MWPSVTPLGSAVFFFTRSRMRGQAPESLSFITHLITFKNLDVLNCPSALIQKKQKTKPWGQFL